MVVAILIALIVITSLSLVAYSLLPREIKWVMSSVIDIPVCTSRIADKLKIQPEIGAVREYMIQSVRLGMTSDEVETTLNRIAPISIINTFVDNKQGLHQEIIVEICDNPGGNVLLFTYYSKDGHLINIGDAYAE